MADIALELSAWVVDNYCSYDIAPIVELREGDRTEVGFELNLHAELPWKGKFTPELRAKAEEIREKLTELVDVLVPKDSEKEGRVPIESLMKRHAHPLEEVG